MAVADLTARRYARLKSLVIELWSRSITARRLALQDVETTTRAEVLGMLGRPVDPALTSLLQRAAAPLEDDAPPAAGLRLGAWTLTGELGQGGMGHVMEAERSDGLYRQRAAVKLLRGRPDRDALARLARERQILARLQHVNIARLLDGGTTAEGQPYLVLERIDGEPIDRWCVRTEASLATRLGLVDQVCAALLHAHQRLVVHCDIKPSNVLVDGDGCVRLLDFGIARLQEEAALDWSPAMTPAYASPEQRAGEAPGVTSDLYSLGRLVDELLAAVPLAPSRRRELRAVLSRATAERPQERYPDVSSFLADLHRFRDRRPVQALRGSSLRWHRYRLANHWGRWWGAWTAAAIALGMLVAFTLQLAVERDRAREAERLATLARDRAAHEAEVARQVGDFTIGLFQAADSRLRSRAADTPVRELLGRGHQQLMARQDEPALRARLLDVLGTVYENIGQVDVAAQIYAQALQLRPHGDTGGPEQARAAELLYKIAFTLNRQGRYEQALGFAQRLMTLRGGPGTGAVERSDAHNAMGVVLTNLGQLDEAAVHLHRALHLRREALGPSSDQVSQVQVNLALLALAQRRWDEATGWVLQARRTDAEAGRAEPSKSRRLVILALAHEGRGERARAEGLLAEAANDARRRYGQDGAPLHRVLRELGRLQATSGRAALGLRTLDEALQAARAGGDDGNPIYAVTLAWHAALLAERGSLSTARAEFAEARALAGSALGPAHWALRQIDQLAGAEPTPAFRPRPAASGR